MSASSLEFLWLCLLLFSCCMPLGAATWRHHWPAGSSTRFYEFKVQTTKITKLCKTKEIVTVNGEFPGPIIYAREDERVIVSVINQTPHNITIHWHGVRQRLSCWSDGPMYVTQCPIQPGQSYAYEFTLVRQKGTLLWHAHVSWLRATVHGALVVYPKTGVPYPFPQPYEEHTIISQEYWHRRVLQLEKRMLKNGGDAPVADAYLINGHPGPKYNCSDTDVFEVDVVPGKTYLLRLVNMALNTEHFFTIANHKMTVVEADGEYTKPFTADQVLLVPGQTINVLVTADQPIGKYDMAISPYVSGQGASFLPTPAIAHFQYSGAAFQDLSLPAELPSANDTALATSTMDNLRSLNASDVLPADVDADLFFTVGLNVDECHPDPAANKTCQGLGGGAYSASVNNVSFVLPEISLLQAYYENVSGVYTEDFPGAPLKNYDFVDGAPNEAPKDTQAMKGTRVKVLEYGTRVQIVLQDTGTVATENHPIHLHGYSFYVVGYGVGDYNPMTARLNLVDPPLMNTIGVHAGGWAAIRFVADNPGVWYMHCHLEAHHSWGLAMAFIVKNGEGPLERLAHPPADYPIC